MIKGILITTNSAEITSAEDKLNVWYTLLNCDCIDIITRKIGDKYYDIVCDDEALLKSEPLPRAVCRNAREVLFGNIFICGLADDEGNLTSLGDDDVEKLARYILQHPDLGPILNYNI